ncbi:MAG: AAA family ATPase [Candidatus Nomurabacteria bacterium]|jgi:predicted AAA+ superfamily ATPase|nr:AAA family ATPase [Candidatus Nomurabacteria bacterium]
MKRKLMDELKKWKVSKDRKPLLMKGARQVGKTYLLQEFGRNEYDSVAYINFQKPPAEIVEIFNGTIRPERIISNLEIALNMEIVPGKTLIIFDEVQDVPRALESLKYFAEDAPEYHIVSSGSLLGIFLHKDTSFPVGMVNHLRLEPMDFEEFLIAKGEERLVKALHKESSTSLPFREKLVDAFREYCFVGGMPRLVSDWVENGNYNNVGQLQDEILNDYRGDFSKHTDDMMAMRIRQVFDSLPAQFAKKNDKFVYGVAKAGARAREYELAIEWLVDAGIVRRVVKVERGDKIPLKAYQDRSTFKLYFVDIGLFCRLSEIPSDVIIKKEAIFNEFNGLIAEQFVLQQLADHTLYYWTSQSESEVDFVMQFENQVIPVEVKSGTNVKAKSLKVYREKYQPTLAIRFSLLDLVFNDGLLNIPLYYSFLFDSLLDYYT